MQLSIFVYLVKRYMSFVVTVVCPLSTFMKYSYAQYEQKLIHNFNT